MFWKESFFISVLFYYYDFLSDTFFILNYWLDLCFAFQFVTFGFVCLTYFVLFCVASHGRGSSPSAVGFLRIRVSFCHFKYSQNVAIKHESRRTTPKMSYWTECSALQCKDFLYPFCKTPLLLFNGGVCKACGFHSSANWANWDLI